jgi:eukaryotic-like serine/threonine-protein kinase
MGGTPEVGRFNIRTRIGTGGMGEVYLATSPGPRGVEKLVAIKLIRGLQDQDHDLVGMFIEEAKVSFLLSHPNIVHTYEIGEVDGHFFLVMEYVDGITLGALMHHFREALRQPMPTRFALHVAAEVARGLDYAHTLTDQDKRPLGIVHRDVSASNVLLSNDGQVKVSDFGLAISALREYESQSGEVKGKAAYMAPEQVAGRKVDARADLFALGVLLYEMLSGRNPFAENRRDITIAARIRGMSIYPLAQAADHVPPTVIEAVERCLALEPEGRFASAREVARTLEACLRQLGQSVSSYDFADFVKEARVAARVAPTATHPFDRALGMVIQRVKATGGVERYITLPPVAGQAPLVARPTAEVTTDEKPGPGRAATVMDTAATTPASLHADLTASDAGPRQQGLQAALQLGLGRDSAASPEPASQSSSLAAEASMSVPRIPVWRRWGPAGVVLGLALIAATLVLVVGLRGPPPVTTPAGTGSSHAVRPAVVDAVPARGLDGAVAAAAADARPARPTGKIARPGRGTGFLSVNSEPWSNVSVDGAPVQSTPLVRHKLPAGTHRVLLVNPARSLRAERRVTIRAGQVTELVVELTR